MLKIGILNGRFAQRNGKCWMLGNGIKLKMNVCADFLQLFNGRRQLSLQLLHEDREISWELIINMTIISVFWFSWLNTLSQQNNSLYSNTMHTNIFQNCRFYLKKINNHNLDIYFLEITFNARTWHNLRHEAPISGPRVSQCFRAQDVRRTEGSPECYTSINNLEAESRAKMSQGREGERRGDKPKYRPGRTFALWQTPD